MQMMVLASRYHQQSRRQTFHVICWPFLVLELEIHITFLFIFLEDPFLYAVGLYQFEVLKSKGRAKYEYNNYSVIDQNELLACP